MTAKILSQNSFKKNKKSQENFTSLRHVKFWTTMKMFRYNIQKQFVIVSIDKAANNFSFMNDSKNDSVQLIDHNFRQ